MLNHWTYTVPITLAAQAVDGVGINLGITNHPPGLLLSASVHPSALLGGAHELTLVEGADISNTMDPERGVHRHRGFGNALPDWLYLKLGMVHDDIHVFHAPGSFQVGSAGATLWIGQSTGCVPLRMPRFLLTPGDQPAASPARYYHLRLRNLEASPAAFVVQLHYRFADPTA